MKIRIDFVSNSSSSSFILKDAGFFKLFCITKQDIYDAIVELYGGKERIDELTAEAISNAEKRLADAEAEPDDGWSRKFYADTLKRLKTKGLELFCVFDMKDEKDRVKCFKEWDDHFSSWYAPNEGEYHDWNTLLETLHWKCSFENIEKVANGEDAQLKVSHYDPKKDEDVEEDFPDGAAMLKHIKRSLKVKTMKEVLHDKDCTLMIHFADNEVYNLAGMQEYGRNDARDYSTEDVRKQCETSEWESKNYSADRFFEVLIKHFIKKGRIDLAEPKLLEYWKINDDDTWYKDRHPDKKYYLDGDVATWRDVVNDCLNCNAIMHEG